jgi:alpha-amylase/alpha-mannosidase (GH57 family)
VDDLVRRIEHLAVANEGASEVYAAVAGTGGEESVLSIIMDGENAWEYFPYNGSEFLSLLYQRLGSHPAIRLTTFSALLPHLASRPLAGLVAGSWVYGTFSTWVGDAAKNRAWDLLIDAKSAVDLALAPELTAAAQEGREPSPRVFAVLRQLAVCEASDWFWWLGEDNRLEDGPAFDLLYRQQLAGLYQLIGMESPAALEMSINSSLSSALDPGTGPNAGQRPAAAGAMRPAHE